MLFIFYTIIIIIIIIILLLLFIMFVDLLLFVEEGFGPERSPGFHPFSRHSPEPWERQLHRRCGWEYSTPMTLSDDSDYSISDGALEALSSDSDSSSAEDTVVRRNCASATRYKLIF